MPKLKSFDEYINGSECKDSHGTECKEKNTDGCTQCYRQYVALHRDCFPTHN